MKPKDFGLIDLQFYKLAKETSSKGNLFEGKVAKIVHAPEPEKRTFGKAAQ